MRSLTKSPLAFVREALAAAELALPAYSHRNSPKKFTQRQLFAMLAFKEFMQLDYRGTEALLHEWSDIREALGIEKVPHYSTLKYASDRLLKKTA